MYQSDLAPWLEFFAWNTDGSAKTDLVYNTSGISIVVVRDNQANSSALTLSAASGPTDWAAGKFWPMGGNKYRVGLATASISSFTGQISVEGTYTGGVITGVTREVSAYNPAGNPNTIAPATPTNVSDVQTAILAKLPAALIGGRMDASVGAMANNTLTAAAISADAGAELAALVETYIVNEGDATAVMQAVADKIAQDWVAGDASPLAIAAAVWSNATRTITGGSLTTSPPTATAIADEVQTRTIARVTLVDTCATNTDMRGTDGALTTLGANAPAGWLNAAAFASGAFNAVWTVTTRGLTEAVELDSPSAQTLADLAAMITGSGTPDAKVDAQALENAPAGGGGGGRRFADL